MKIQNAEVKEKLIQRLSRIEGQVRGVQTMFNDERDCREIMQQLVAIRSAIQSTSRTFLQEYATACLLAMDDSGIAIGSADMHEKRGKLVQEMITLLDKVP
jgi:DNA-binding FrmR family transcriptional regulator